MRVILGEPVYHVQVFTDGHWEGLGFVDLNKDVVEKRFTSAGRFFPKRRLVRYSLERGDWDILREAV